MEEMRPSRFRITAAARFEESAKIPWVHCKKEMFAMKLFDFINSPRNKNFADYRFASCMLKIISNTLFAMPEMNVKWRSKTEKEDLKIIRYDELKLGMALETIINQEPSSAVAGINGRAKDGFIDAWRMNLYQINARILELSGKAKAGELASSDFELVPNIIFNNLGTFENIDLAAPLPPPFCSLMVSVFRAKVKEVYLEDKCELVLLKMMPVVVSFDHRLFDGPKMNQFIGLLKKNIENPQLN